MLEALTSTVSSYASDFMVTPRGDHEPEITPRSSTRGGETPRRVDTAGGPAPKRKVSKLWSRECSPLWVPDPDAASAQDWVPPSSARSFGSNQSEARFSLGAPQRDRLGMLERGVRVLFELAAKESEKAQQLAERVAQLEAEHKILQKANQSLVDGFAKLWSLGHCKDSLQGTAFRAPVQSRGVGDAQLQLLLRDVDDLVQGVRDMVSTPQKTGRTFGPLSPALQPIQTPQPFLEEACSAAAVAGRRDRLRLKPRIPASVRETMGAVAAGLPPEGSCPSNEPQAPDSEQETSTEASAMCLALEDPGLFMVEEPQDHGFEGAPQSDSLSSPCASLGPLEAERAAVEDGSPGTPTSCFRSVGWGTEMASDTAI